MSDDGATLSIWLRCLDSLLGRGANSGRQGEAEGSSRRQGGEAGAPGGRGWRDGPGVAASGMERRRHTGILKGEGTGERMLPRWGLGEGGAVVEQSGARPPWSMFPRGCFGPGLLCHTYNQLNSQNNPFK